MKTIYNRFALIPFHCTDCHRYIWLEKYRKVSPSPSVPCFTKRKICKKCLKKYDVIIRCHIREVVRGKE